MSYNSVNRCVYFCDGGTVKREDEKEGGKQIVTRLRINILFFSIIRGGQGRIEDSLQGMN